MRAPVLHPPSRPRTASTGSRWAGWLAAAALVGVAGGYAAIHLDHAESSAASSSTATSGASTYAGGDNLGEDPGDDPSSPAPGDGTATPSGQAVATGATVDYSQVLGDSSAEAVATMFARHFGAINEHHYDTALKYFDPGTGAVDLGSASSRARWKETMHTTQDGDIVLTDLSSDGRYTLATIGFTSHQDPGYGPAGSTDDTCDRWTITYQLTDTDGYRIYKAPREGVSHTSC